MTITEGLKVDARRRTNGVCTGRASSTRSFPDGAERAEVVWPEGHIGWPLVSALKTK